MRTLKWIGMLVIVLAVAFVVGALLITPTYRVERSTTIAAPPAKIYPLVAAPKAWPTWTVWNQREPNMKMAFSGPESGKGAKWAWEGQDGKGEMEFTEADPERGIRYRLSFVDMGMTSMGGIAFAPAGNATKVTWTNEGDVGWNLMGRWFVPFMDRMMGPDFEANLANLKARAEKGGA